MIPTAAVPSATPAATSALVAYESPVFGYRISLPRTYRQLKPQVFPIDSELLGRDAYTLLTQEQERDSCFRDLGDIPDLTTAGKTFSVEVYRNPRSLSATEWAKTPLAQGGYVYSTHRRIDTVTIGGRDAVRLVADNATAEVQAIVVRADDRIYVITPSFWPSEHRFDDIAATFATVARQPLPTATPTPDPGAMRRAATDLAAALSRAFAAKDADAVARLMPDCHLSVGGRIDGQGLANSGGGVITRSVPGFVQALRARFAAGDLTVTVDPALGSDAFGQVIVRSQWQEPDRTVPIDLVIGERDGRWQWTGAVHYYTRAQTGSPVCIPFRTPWVPEYSRGC